MSGTIGASSSSRVGGHEPYLRLPRLLTAGLPVRFPARPTSLRHRLATYLSTVTWLARDLFVRNLWFSATLVALSILAVAARLLTFVVLASFAQAAVSGEPAEFRGWNLPFGAEGRELAWALGAIGGFATLAAAASYAEGRVKLALGQRYARRTVARVAERIAALRATPNGVPVPDVTYLQRLVGSDAIILFRLVQPATGLILPSIQTVAMLALMSWIDPFLTSMLLAVGALYFLPFLRINREVVRAAASLEDGRQAFVDQNRRTAHGLLLDQYPQDMVTMRWLRGPEFNGLLDATSRLLGNRYVVQLANDLFFGAVALLLVLYISVRTSDATDSVTSLVVYVIIARYAYGSISTMTRSFAAVNRFLPQFQRYAVLLAQEPSPKTQHHVPTPEAGAALIVDVDPTRPLTRSVDRLDIPPGSATAVLAPQTIDPLRLPVWWLALSGEPVPRRVFFVPPDALSPDIRLSDLLGPRTRSCDDPAVQDPPPIQAAAALMEVCRHLQRDVVVMSRVTWNETTAEERSAFKEQLAEVRLVVMWDHAPGSLDPLLDHVVVMDAEERVVGAGGIDWFASARPSVVDIFSDAATAAPPSRTGLDDALLDDDLM